MKGEVLLIKARGAAEGVLREKAGSLELVTLRKVHNTQALELGEE